jgi:CRP-like cAMP-binding protein
VTLNGSHEWSPETFVGRLRAAERQALFGLGGSVRYPAGGYLLVEGDRSRFVLILHGGPVKVVVHDRSGREYLLGLRGRGDLLGELAYLDSQPRSASVVALRPVSVTKICADQFSRFLDEHSRAGIELTRCVGQRLRDADRTRLELSVDDVPVRVIRLLRNLARRSVAESTRRHAVIPLTQGQLAQLAHAAEVTVNRVLREFRDRGLVRTAYRSIEVPCVGCLDLLLMELSTEPKANRKEVHGCGGHNAHRVR